MNSKVKFACSLVAVSTIFPLFMPTLAFADNRDGAMPHLPSTPPSHGPILGQGQKNVTTASQLGLVLNFDGEKHAEKGKDQSKKQDGKRVDNQSHQSQQAKTDRSHENSGLHLGWTLGFTNHADSKVKLSTAEQAQLKTEWQTLSQDFSAAKQARAALMQSAHTFVAAMSKAASAQDATALQLGNVQSAMIITNLKTALTAQVDVAQGEKRFNLAKFHGDWQAALTAMTQADTEETSKTAAMTQAANALNQLSATIDAAVTTNTATNTATNTTQNSTNSVVSSSITVNNTTN